VSNGLAIIFIEDGVLEEAIDEGVGIGFVAIGRIVGNLDIEEFVEAS
jgi:hypothetical protein